jgi:hypothetical protein
MLPLTLAVGAGCVGTPASTSIRRTPRPTVVKSASPTTDGTNSLKFPSPRATPSVARVSPAPSKAPTPRPSPSPQASVTPVLAQPVAINPTAEGFSTTTRNYLVVSAATASPDASYQMALGSGGTAGTATAYRTLSAETDRHVAFRDFERRAIGGLVPPKSTYRALATTTLTEGAERPFYVITSFDQNSYKDKQITARLAKVGAHCYVFVDKDVSKVAADAALMAKRVEAIAENFDTQIYPTDTRLFGSEPNPGVDGDPHIVLLLSPAVGNYGADTTLGYFSQRDEFLPSVSQQPIFQHSNAKEMLYISSRIVLTGSEEDYMGTVAHEFQHMINFNQKVLLGGNRQSDDLWIDEGMAMYAIEANGYGLRTGGKVLSDHVKRYQQEPEAFSLTDWTGNPDGIGYGPVYLFMVYLADRFSETIIKDIVTSKVIGIPNVETKLKERGTDFRHVFHDWAMANLLDGRTTGMSQLFQYQSLKMTGLSGKTRLDGVSTNALRTPGTSTWKLRPYTAQYYELPTGAVAPTFGFTPATTTAVQPRLVLP